MARLKDGLQSLDQDGDARKIVGHAPAMNAAVVDDAGKGIAFPGLGPGHRLAVGMGEEDDAAAAALASESRDDALALALIDRTGAGELRHHRHVGRPVAHRLDCAAERPRGVGDNALHRRLAVGLGADQRLQEGHGIAHQIITRACLRRRMRIRLKVV